jgi:hypothetical protein
VKEFMTISNLLGIDSISDVPISNLVMLDPSPRAPPLGLLLARSSDLGDAVFASTRGPFGQRLFIIVCQMLLDFHACKTCSAGLTSL